MALKRQKRNVKIIFPSTITTFSMVIGFVAILLATNGQIHKACYLIMVCILMDGLDGKVARLTNTASEFGIQYDSLADLVAFGVTPCVIYARFFLHQQVTDQIYYLLPMMFLICGAIRLARFNVTASIYGKSFFTGLPIPAAAFMLAILPLLHRWALNSPAIKKMGWLDFFSLENYFQFSIFMIAALGWSMISTLKFDTPTGFWLRRFKSKALNYLVIGLFLSLIFIDFSVFGAAISLYYLAFNYGRAIHSRTRRGDTTPTDPP